MGSMGSLMVGAVKNTYKIADIVFEATLQYKYVIEVLKDYLYDGPETPELTIEITDEDILHEKSLDTIYQNLPDAYYASLAVFRKICDYGLKYKQAIVFHSSAISVDGDAYLFTAPSGTGKSTHARLWRELLGNRAVMVNDDKPIIRYVDGDFYVYGTPWNGKHHLGSNIKAKIKAICLISQAKENKIEKISTTQMLFTILNQTIRPSEVEVMDNLLALTEKLLTKVKLYKLECNVSLDAAKLSYQTMSSEV